MSSSTAELRTSRFLYNVPFHPLSIFVTIFLPSFLFAACYFILVFINLPFSPPRTSPVLPINDVISPLAAPPPVSGLHPLLAATNFQFWKGKASWEGCYVCKKCWESRKTDPFSNLKLTYDIKCFVSDCFFYINSFRTHCFPLISSDYFLQVSPCRKASI